MKITDLNNAPKWLLDANTTNADVEITDGVVIWHDGVWYGGVWRGGVWRGGDWRGGVWQGGDWRGGIWQGGVWQGGVWWGGVWWGGDWRGEQISSPLLTVFGLRWPITISPTRMQIGCELHSFSDWHDFDDARIAAMDRGALKFWKSHKDALLMLCASRVERK